MLAGDIHRQRISAMRGQYLSARLIDDLGLNPYPQLFHWAAPVAGRVSCVISSPRDRHVRQSSRQPEDCPAA